MKEPQKLEPVSDTHFGFMVDALDYLEPSSSVKKDMSHRDPALNSSPENRTHPPSLESDEALSCGRITRFLMGIPFILIVFALIFWTWFVHLLRMDVSLYHHEHEALAISDGVVFHVLLVLLSLSYARVTFSNPGFVRLSPTAASAAGSVPIVQPREEHRTFCTKCQGPKPDRAHHCRLCGRCVERMDHHCPWVNNCVGRDNYKFFVLFLLYTCIAALYNTITVSVWASSAAIAGDAMGWSLVWINVFATGVFGVVVFFFTGFHISLIAKNQTTIESLDKRAQYDLGSARANFDQVLGRNAWLWLLPVRDTQSPGEVVRDLESGHAVDAGARSS